MLDELFAEAPAAAISLLIVCRNFSSGGFSHLNTVPFSSKPSHTFRQKTTFEDFPIKPTSEGIKEEKLSSLSVLTVEQLAAATTSGLGAKYHVSLFSHAKKLIVCYSNYSR